MAKTELSQRLFFLHKKHQNTQPSQIEPAQTPLFETWKWAFSVVRKNLIPNFVRVCDFLRSIKLFLATQLEVCNLHRRSRVGCHFQRDFFSRETVPVSRLPLMAKPTYWKGTFIFLSAFAQIFTTSLYEIEKNPAQTRIPIIGFYQKTFWSEAPIDFP